MRNVTIILSVDVRHDILDKLPPDQRVVLGIDELVAAFSKRLTKLRDSKPFPQEIFDQHTAVYRQGLQILQGPPWNYQFSFFVPNRRSVSSHSRGVLILPFPIAMLLMGMDHIDVGPVSFGHFRNNRFVAFVRPLEEANTAINQPADIVYIPRTISNPPLIGPQPVMEDFLFFGPKEDVVVS